MTGRVLPLFSGRGKAKTLGDDMTATRRRAVDVWLRDYSASPRTSKADRARAAEIRLALMSGVYVPSDDAVAWLRRRAKRAAAECGWLAAAALEELVR